MFILPAVIDHLSWETTKFSGRFMQVSQHKETWLHYTLVMSATLNPPPYLLNEGTPGMTNNFQKTLHSSPMTVSYGGSFFSILEKNGHAVLKIRTLCHAQDL